MISRRTSFQRERLWIPSFTGITRIFLVFCLLSACSFSRDGGYGRQFALEAAAIPAHTYRNSGQSLKVALPSAAPELDTDRIAVIQPDGRQDYIANAKWADFLPVLMQSALVQSFASSGRYGNVMADDTSARSRYVLAVTIENFEIEMPKAGMGARAHVRLRMKLLPAGGTRVLREAVLENSRQIPSGQLSEMMGALIALFRELEEQAVARMGPR